MEEKPHYLQLELCAAALQLSGAPGREGSPLHLTGRAGTAFTCAERTGGGFLALLLAVFVYFFSRDGGGGVRVWLLFTPASLQTWLDSGSKGRGGEADPPLPLHQTHPSKAGGLLCGRAEPCSAWQAIGRCKQIHHCSQLTGAGQAWASVVYRGRREEE